MGHHFFYYIHTKGESIMEQNFLKNVYGYKEIKEELYLIREWYFESDQLGEKKKLLPKGILFWGEPGDGKTHLAREYSNSFGYPIFVIEGNGDNLENEIISAYNLARNEKNAIVIIDELDTLIDKDEKLKRVLQSQLDGFNNSGNVLTIATSNKFYDLPEPLLREGRFDRKFKVHPNNKSDFQEIIKGFSLNCGLNLTDDEILELADNFSNYSVSTIRATLNSASLRYGNSCTINDLLNSVDFIDTGFINKRNDDIVQKNVAIHEAGHAIYLYFFSKTERFLRIYFHDGGGNTIYKSINDMQTAECLIDKIRCGLAGLIAEELILKKHDVGCCEDLEQVCKLTFILINECCYEKVDHIAFRINFYDRDDISSYKSKIFDVRTAKFIQKNYRYVKKCLRRRKKDICKVADYLMKNQSIKANELTSLLSGGNKTESKHVLFPKIKQIYNFIQDQSWSRH